MKTIQKPAEEKLEVEELKGRLFDRLKDRFGRHPDKALMTHFGDNRTAVEELARRVLEFRDREEKIVINEIGLGMSEWRGFRLAGMNITKRNVSYEPFELLNAIRNAGVKPEEFVLYAIDINSRVLLAVKATKLLRIQETEVHDRREYFSRFFRDFQGRGEDRTVEIVIPEEYRKRMVCPKPLDITKEAAPVKADITFAYIPTENPLFLESLANSTKKGGYILCYYEFEGGILERLGLERVASDKHAGLVYRAK